MGIKVPKGKFIGTVKVGEKGQIVIPKGCRDLFGIEPGDTLILLADIEQGIAIAQNQGYLDFANGLFEGSDKKEEASE